MDKFMEEVQKTCSNYTECDPDDRWVYTACDKDTGNNWVHEAFYDKYPDENIDDLIFIQICPDEELALFRMKNKNIILIFGYEEYIWYEFERTYKNICGYDCEFYLLEDKSPIDPEAIVNASFDNVIESDVQKIAKIYADNVDWDNPLELNIDSSYKLKLIHSDEIYRKYIIQKNGETIFEYDDSDGDYSDDIISLCVYKTNLIIHSCGNNGGCIIIKNIL